MRGPMSAPPFVAGAAGTWSFVAYTSNPEALTALEELQGRFPTLRFMAVVPEMVTVPEGLTQLTDRGGRLASSMGIAGGATRTYAIDGRGTVCHHWDGVPEAEAVHVFADRPAMPSGAPAWLFPVLAAAVLVAGIVTWGMTRPAPTTVDLSTVPPAPAVAAAPVAAPVPPVAATPEAAAPEAEEGALPEDALGGAEEGTAPQGAPITPAKGKKGAATVDGWQILPRDAGSAHVSAADGVLRLNAMPAADLLACREPVALTALTAVAAGWKLSGVEGKPGARLTVRMLDAAGKPVKGSNVVVGRARGTLDWTPLATKVTAAEGAVEGRICLELSKGSGTVELRKLIVK